MERIQVTYGEFTITYHEHDNYWQAKDAEGSVISAPKSLVEAKKACDKYASKEKTFKRQNVWRVDESFGRTILDTGVVTSIADDGKVWVTWKERGREKLWSVETLCLDIPENEPIKKRLLEIGQQKMELDKESQKLLKSAKTLLSIFEEIKQ